MWTFYVQTTLIFCSMVSLHFTWPLNQVMKVWYEYFLTLQEFRLMQSPHFMAQRLFIYPLRTDTLQ